MSPSGRGGPSPSPGWSSTSWSRWPSARGRSCTKDDLLRQVWGYAGRARTRTVDSHASRLRRSLIDAGAPGTIIVNVWGIGYRLVVAGPGASRVNRPGDDTSGLRAAVRAALEADDLEPAVRALLELRFPAEGPGASLDEAGAALCR